MRTTPLIAEYHRARLLRRVLLSVFGIVVVSTVLWALPWVPGGLTTSDYEDLNVSLLLGMVVVAWLTAFGAIYMRDVANRHEQTLATWSSVHDELGVLRRREYFFERIALECQRTEVTGRAFAVFSTQFAAGVDGDEEDLTDAAVLALNSLVRDSDRLAVLGPGEIGLVGSSVGVDEAPRVAQRIRTTLAEVATEGDESRIDVGWAIFGPDGKDPGALVGAARGRMQGKAFAQTTVPPRVEPDAAGTAAA